MTFITEMTSSHQARQKMNRKLFITTMVLLLITSLISPLVFAADEISVFINGRKISFDVPPAKISGRTMVPLRGIFEGLGAEVKWEAATMTITAKRGDTEVKLTLGDKNAYINGNLNILDVPPAKVSGRTMVPLRFVGEAFKAEVKWVGATKSIYINDETASAPQPAITATPEPAGNAIEGTVSSITYSSLPNKIMVKKGNALYTYEVTPQTVIRLTEVDGTFSGSINLRQLQKGDYVMIAPDPANQSAAKSIEGKFRKVSGVISAFASNKVIMKDGTVIALNPEAEVYMQRKRVSISELQPGREAYFRINPVTNESWWVTLKGVKPSASPTPGEVVITDFIHDGNRTVDAGDVVTFSFKGTPGGNATFSIPGVGSAVMLETSPGYYSGTYTIKRTDKSGMIYPFGILAVGGWRTKTVKSTIPLYIRVAAGSTSQSLDPKAPFISSPANNTTVPSTFMVMGKGEPGVRIFISIQQLTALGPVAADLGTVKQETVADANGDFKSQFSFAIAPKDCAYIIKVYQQRPDGKISPTSSVQAKQR